MKDWYFLFFNMFFFKFFLIIGVLIFCDGGFFELNKYLLNKYVVM